MIFLSTHIAAAHIASRSPSSTRSVSVVSIYWLLSALLDSFPPRTALLVSPAVAVWVVVLLLACLLCWCDVVSCVACCVVFTVSVFSSS